MQDAIKKGPEFFQNLDVKLRPIAPFIQKPKLPRAIRQKVLDKLTGQHLSLETVLHTNSTTNNETTVSPPSAGAGAAGDVNVSLEQRAIAAAVEQEADIYNRCSSAQVYQNLAARCSALDWRKEVRAAAEAEQAYEDLLTVQRQEEGREATEGGRKRKKSRLNSSSTEVGNGSNGKTKLVESDLAWDHAKPDKTDDILHQQLRRRVMQALESCPKWSLLPIDQRVATVERCTLKITNSGGDLKRIEDTALQRLAMQYIDFMLKNTKT